MSKDVVWQWSTSACVGGVAVADAPWEEVVPRASVPAQGAPRVVLALHVGGLLELGNREFVQALKCADVLYADGAAVVLLARVGGAKRITRAATTDIGLPVLHELAAQLGRPARISLLGGPAELAERAAQALESAAPVEVQLALSGYFSSDAEVLQQLRSSNPDLVLVGMGMPREALWVHQNRDALPHAVILTCGGWFGFLAGDERRAPVALQRLGLEWSFRLAQDSRRLAGRYLRGSLVVASLLPRQWRHRRRPTQAQRTTEHPDCGCQAQ